MPNTGKLAILSEFMQAPSIVGPIHLRYERHAEDHDAFSFYQTAFSATVVRKSGVATVFWLTQ